MYMHNKCGACVHRATCATERTQHTQANTLNETYVHVQHEHSAKLARQCARSCCRTLLANIVYGTTIRE